MTIALTTDALGCYCVDDPVSEARERDRQQCHGEVILEWFDELGTL